MTLMLICVTRVRVDDEQLQPHVLDALRVGLYDVIE